MAAEGELEKEIVEHRKGYEGFIALFKWGTILSAIIALAVVFIIAE
jgi:hypothetical protein